MSSDTIVLSDSDLLDFLDSLSHSGKIVLRMSTTGRGWRLHETSSGTWEDEADTVRDAILNYMDLFPSPLSQITLRED